MLLGKPTSHDDHYMINMGGERPKIGGNWLLNSCSLQCWINVAGVLQEAEDATQCPTPDSKCKLNISSFHVLLLGSHLLDCLICFRNVMSIVLFLLVMGEWDRCGVVYLY